MDNEFPQALLNFPLRGAIHGTSLIFTERYKSCQIKLLQKTRQAPKKLAKFRGNAPVAPIAQQGDRHT